MRKFKELKVWREGIELVKNVYRITKKFPYDEVYFLTSQVKRSSVSIPSNIAGGQEEIQIKISGIFSELQQDHHSNLKHR